MSGSARAFSTIPSGVGVDQWFTYRRGAPAAVPTAAVATTPTSTTTAHESGAAAPTTMPPPPTTAPTAARSHVLTPDQWQLPDLRDPPASGAPTSGASAGNLTRVRIEPIFSNYQRLDADSVNQLRPADMAPLPDAQLTEIMSQENEIQRRRELIEENREVQFVRYVANLTNTRFDVSSQMVTRIFGKTTLRPENTLAPGLAPTQQSPHAVPTTMDARISHGVRRTTLNNLSTHETPNPSEQQRPAARFFTTTNDPPPTTTTTTRARTPATTRAPPSPSASANTVLDFMQSDNPALQRIGDEIDLATRTREAQIYAKRIEATGLVIFDSLVDSHSRAAFNELKASPGNRVRDCPSFLHFVHSSLWEQFGDLVAAHINRKNGGIAPTRDVLDKQFGRTGHMYAQYRRNLVNTAIWRNNRIEERTGGANYGGRLGGGGGGGGGDSTMSLQNAQMYGLTANAGGYVTSADYWRNNSVSSETALSSDRFFS